MARPPTYAEVSRRRVWVCAAGVRGMDAEPEAYMDVFTASAAQTQTRRRRIGATQAPSGGQSAAGLRGMDAEPEAYEVEGSRTTRVAVWGPVCSGRARQDTPNEFPKVSRSRVGSCAAGVRGMDVPKRSPRSEPPSGLCLCSGRARHGCRARSVHGCIHSVRCTDTGPAAADRSHSSTFLHNISY